MKGPGPGIKFRGGAPPAAPVWRYQSNDVRAYEKYERKVRMWQLQVKQYMSAAEAGLALYSSLQGEAEQQLEFVELDMIFHKGGVDFILEQLKNAFQQKTVYVKRHHLHEYENMARYPQESIRAYTNRYKRVEAALKAIGVDISLTYDAEARGSRLLDRARLSGEQQRMILVGTRTNGQLDFNAVAAAMIMQYPDYKPAPMVVTRDGKGNQKGNQGYSSSSSSASTTASGSSTASSQSSSRRKGEGKRFDKSRRVFQTINEEVDDAQDGQEEDVDEAPEEQDDDGDQENAEDGEEIEAENNEFEELAQVLTVTAKKLASITQGRKYKNAPRKSIEQRKKETTCAACGNKGHWAGDPECEVSGGTSFSKDSKTSNSAGSSSTRATRPKSGNFEKNKKVFTVRHYTGFDHEEEEHDHQQHDTPHLCQVVFQADDIPHITMHNAHESLGYMTIDTACQRSCCGWVWHDAHIEVLKNDVMASPIYKTQREKFQFGAGEPQTSNTLVLFPSALGEVCCYLGASLLPANIPFLCSLRALDKLGLVLDLPNRCAVFRAVNREVPLVYLNGQFPSWIFQTNMLLRKNCKTWLIMDYTILK